MRKRSGSNTRLLPQGIIMLYEDKDILVVDKPEGLLTVATVHERSRTAHSLLTEYIRRGTGRSRKQVFVVHRLDRDTSGVLIFAKSEEAMERLKDRWKETEKKYLAIVHGTPEERSGTITSYLAEDADYTVYETQDSSRGKLAQTVYSVIGERKRMSLLEVTLLTGRKNQIRVHLAGIGHPIVGDEKYGQGDDRMPRMALHALSISFKHPFTGKQLAFESEVPELFTRLFGSMGPKNSETPPGERNAAQPMPAKGNGFRYDRPEKKRTHGSR